MGENNENQNHHDEVYASVGVVEEVRKSANDGIDAFITACYGDPGLYPAREVASVPVGGNDNTGHDKLHRLPHRGCKNAVLR